MPIPCGPILAFVVAVAVAQAPSQSSVLRDTPRVEPAGADISGRVIASDTNQPIRKARVSLIAESGQEVALILTDGDGQFRFANRALGRYTLVAGKTGYVTTRLGARRALDPPSRIDLTSGTAIGDLTVRLARGGAITGHVTNDLGEPMLDVLVAACQIQRGAGRSRPVIVRTTRSDDLGEYRLGGLAAGSYIISAKVGMPTQLDTPGLVVVSDTFSEAAAYPPIYFPSTASLAQARPVFVEPGREVAGTDLMFRQTRTPRLIAPVTTQDGAPVASGRWVLFPQVRGADVGHAGPFSRAIDAAVPPGEWFLFVSGMRGGSTVLPLSIQEEDVRATLILAEGATVAGRVIFDGTGTPPANLVVTASIPVAMLPPSAGGRVAPDGTFQISQLVGPVEFQVRNLPRGWVMKSMVVNGDDVLDAPLSFRGTEHVTGVTLTITNKLATVTGTVVDAAARMLPDCSVLVFPEDAGLVRDSTRWTRWVRPDTSGHFTVTDLLPGRYLAVAVQDADETQWSAPEYLNQLRPSATRLELHGGERRSLTLTLAAER